MSKDTKSGIESWMDLAHGSPQHEEAISTAVHEMLDLAHLCIDALCRHLPTEAPAIRWAIRHILEHPRCLAGDTCDAEQGALSG